MDTEHVRSGAALEGRPVHRYNPGGQVFRGSTERLPRLPPDLDGIDALTVRRRRGFIEEGRGEDPELASYLRIKERELEAGRLN
jgi:hypothetical protein